MQVAALEQQVKELSVCVQKQAQLEQQAREKPTKSLLEMLDKQVRPGPALRQAGENKSSSETSR